MKQADVDDAKQEYADAAASGAPIIYNNEFYPRWRLSAPLNACLLVAANDVSPPHCNDLSCTARRVRQTKP